MDVDGQTPPWTVATKAGVSDMNHTVKTSEILRAAIQQDFNGLMRLVERNNFEAAESARLTQISLSDRENTILRKALESISNGADKPRYIACGALRKVREGRD